ncbi:MAG TPA: DUF1918 domain-containing protein [Gaiellaceae bacterium]|nr:DUF1918 domain-containing protein [Gaiellaceae bacterium]
MTARRDSIRVDSRAVGGARRAGEIVEVLGSPDRVRYRVRWEDGHETIVYPGSDASLSLPREAPAARGGRARAKKERAPKAGAGAGEQPAPSAVRAAPGDRLVIHAHRVGEPTRDAEILEALGADGGPPFRVRWEDSGAETLFFPGSDAAVEHLARAKTRRRRPAPGAGRRAP